MNILLLNPEGLGAFKYIIRGIYNAFNAAGHKCAWWDGNTQFLHTFEPDIYIGCSAKIQSIPHDIRNKFNTKTCYHVNPYGTKIKNPHGPDINEPPHTIRQILTENPTFVWGYYTEHENENQYWQHWPKSIGIPPAGDCIEFKNLNTPKNYDIAFVGGYWPYKAINLDKYLIPALNQFKHILHGWGGWTQYTNGTLPDGNTNVNKILSSGHIGPCVHEPHTTTYGFDICERIFKVPLCGTLAISDPVSSFKYIFNDLIPEAKNPKEYCDLIQYYLTNHKERDELIAKQRQFMLKNHTYFNRIKSILKNCGYFNECNKIQSIIEDLK